MKRRRFRGVIYLQLLLLAGLFGYASGDQFRYRTPEEINTRIGNIRKANGKIAEMQVLAETPGGRKVNLLELGESRGTNPRRYWS